MLICTPAELVRWNHGGRYPPSWEDSRRLFDGPESQVMNPASEADTMARPTMGVRNWMPSTRIIATNMAFGNSLLGLFSSLTWTAFISMPEYAPKLLTISTMLAIPVHSGSRCSAVIGAALGLP